MNSIKNYMPKHPFKIIFITLILIASIATAVGVWKGYKIIQSTPRITKNKLQSTSTTKIYDKNNKLLYSTNFQSRNYVKYKDIPETYKNALISTEDQSFWTNTGVNFKSTGLAVAGKLSGGRISSRGGSTITQQLIKLSVFSTSAQDQTITRKIQEIWLAIQIRRLFSKKQILEFYVNKIYEGNNAYGAQTISQLYFDKPLSKLNLSQTAIIAGIGQSPSLYNLYSNPKAVAERRNEVLLAMYNNKKIDKQTYRDTIKQDVNYGLISQSKAMQTKNQTTKTAQSYIQSVLDEAIQHGYQVNKQSYKIYTNYDPEVQQKAIDTLNTDSNYNNYNVNGTQSAATVVNPNNGGVIAQVGGRNVDTLFGLNRATQTNRSTGSSIKPIIDYGPAIEYLNWGSNHIVDDKPYTYAGTNIKAYDWDRHFMGPMTIRRALQLSRNVPAIETLGALDGSNHSQDVVKFLSKLGIKAKDYYGGSDAIGINASTAQMSRAFAAIDNGGVYHNYGYIRKIVNSDNQSVNTQNDTTRAMSPATAYILTSMMNSVMNGDGTAAKEKWDGFPNVAGKSGMVAYDSSVGAWTDGASSDSWFVGYTSPDESTNSGLVSAVWSGYDNPNKEGNGFTNLKSAAISNYVWSDLMKNLTTGQKNPKWNKPNTVQVTSGDPNVDFANCDLSPFVNNLKMPSTNSVSQQQEDEIKYWNQKDVNANVQQ